MRTGSDERIGEQGFTLIEALAALVLTGLVLSALATITGQWLPTWNRGLDRIQQSELIGISLQRIAADLAAAEYVSPNREQGKPLFDGSAQSVTFVRRALGPNAGVGLDVVRIGEATDQGRLVTVRSRAAFGPTPIGAAPSEQIRVSDPVALLRPSLRLSFAYAGRDKVFREDWRDQDELPAAIMLTVRDTAERAVSVSTVTPVHVNAPAGPGKSDDKSGGETKRGPRDERGSAGPATKEGGP